jgi:hypothetical protein
MSARREPATGVKSGISHSIMKQSRAAPRFMALSDVIFDNLYHPSEGMTERGSVLALLEGIEDYAHMRHKKEYISILRRLAASYLEKPTFAAYHKLHRSAVAFMFIQDSPSDSPASEEIEEGEIHWLPYGRVMRGELQIVEAVPASRSVRG